MSAKCTYCGAELPIQTDKETRCPVCGEIPPSQTGRENDPAFSQPPVQTPGGPDFSQPPETEPTPAYNQPTAPPPPPPSGPEPPAGPTEHTPAWELDGGFWLAKLWRTIWQVLLHPVLTFSAPGRLDQKKYPLSFAMIMSVFGVVVDAIMDLYLSGSMQSVIPTIFVIIFSPLIMIVVLYGIAGYMNTLLVKVGSGRAGYQATFRVIAYSFSCDIFFAIPLFGVLVGGIWCMVVIVGGLAAAHNTTYGRVIGVMLPGVATILVIVLVMMGGQIAYLSE